jgi:molybdate transport system regulatory protein
MRGKEPSLRVGLRLLLGMSTSIGPGKTALLEAIAATGSISAAGRSLGMSYRRAWQLVESMNRNFREPLVLTATGGARGGGAQVTPFGHEVLRRYRAMEARVSVMLDADLTAFADLLKDRLGDDGA